jgi:hypothetical protein
MRSTDIRKGRKRDPKTVGSMSMARETNIRPVRSGEPYPRDPAPEAGRNNDPLAELARLIGQDDPFAALGKGGRAASRPAGASQGDPSHGAPEWLARQGPPARGAEPHYNDQASHAAPQHDDAADYQAAGHQPGYEDAYYQDGHYQDQPGYEGQQQGYAADAYYDDSQGAYGDEGYDEPPPQRRRGGVMTVAAVVGLALVGTAGVFGYRTWTSPSTSGGEPPVIKAEQTPTKVVPAAPSGDPSKQIYDRVGDRGGEQVVPREEQPVDPKNAVRAAAPAPTTTGMPASTGSVFPPVPAQPQPPGPAGTEPRKVKTEIIRPNQAAAMPPVNQPPARIAATTPATPPPATRSVAASGGYVVQVASQRSEADAHASFKALQQKYPSVLGGYQVVIRRADLGEKGIYYRAQVGPFSTAEQAKEMCGSLKSAGGQCIVQPN